LAVSATVFTVKYQTAMVII